MCLEPRGNYGPTQQEGQREGKRAAARKRAMIAHKCEALRHIDKVMDECPLPFMPRTIGETLCVALPGLRAMEKWDAVDTIERLLKLEGLRA